MTTATDNTPAPKARAPRKRAAAPEAPEAPHKGLHHALLAVMADCPYVQKRTSKGLGYTFAGDRDLIQKVHPALIRHRVTFVPSNSELLYHEEYSTKNGVAMNRVVLKVTYLVTHADSSEKQTVSAVGEGCDQGDKAANKAMTNAHKYALRQLLNIETGDEPDETPSEAQERAVPAAQSGPPPRKRLEARDGGEGGLTEQQKALQAEVRELAASIKAAPTLDALQALWRAKVKGRTPPYGPKAVGHLMDAAKARENELTKAPPEEAEAGGGAPGPDADNIPF